MKVFWISLALLCVSSIETGVLIGFTPETVNDFIKDYLPTLSSSVQSMTIPLITIPSIGKGKLTFDLLLKDLKTPVFNLDSANSGLIFQDDRSILFTLQDITMQTIFDWEISTHGIIQAGSAEALANKATLHMTFKVNPSADLEISVVSSEFIINKLDIKFSKNSSAAVINWVLDALNLKLTQVLQVQVAELMKGTLQGLLDSVTKIKSIQVTPGISISLLQATSPVIDQKHIHFNMEGIVKIDGIPSGPDVPKPVALAWTTSKAMQISLSAYSVNSMFYTIFMANLAKFSTSDMGLAFNCGMIDPVLPGISNQYGSATGIDIRCKAKTTPLLEITGTELATHLSLNCELEVEDHGVPLEIDINLSAFNTLTLKNWLGKGEFTNIEMGEITVVKSSLDHEPNVQGIKDLANLTFKLGRKTFNKMVFGDGYEVPQPVRVIVSDLSFQTMNGYFLLEGSPKVPN